MRSKISTAKTVGSILFGAGATYLTQELVKYKTLSDLFPNTAEEKLFTQEEKMAQAKEWLIIGRQSPGYIREKSKHLESEIEEKRSGSPLVFKVGFTYMANEKDYELFKESDFVVELTTGNQKSVKEIVKPEHMLSTSISKINDEARFEVHFARKPGFVEEIQKISVGMVKNSPLYHSSIALRAIPKDAVPNEDCVILTGKEVKKLVEQTENSVCKAQHCNMYSSNCYSASTFFLAQVIKEIDSRPGDASKKSADIEKIARVLNHARNDNLSRGISNNELVRSELTYQVHPILLKHHLANMTSAENTYNQNSHRKL